MLTRYLSKHEDNAVGRLNAGISAGTLSLVLQTGNGALFPAAKSALTTSVGSSTTLNCSGVSGYGIVAGDVIFNLTDGSVAIVTVASTNSLTTTRLIGGTSNTWGNSQRFSVNPFVVTLINYDTDGTTILKREKVLIESRSSDTLTVNASGRGYDGSSAQSFSSNDYVYQLWTSCATDGEQAVISEALKSIDQHTTDIATKAADASVVHLTGDETVAGIKTFSSFPVTPSSDPTTNYQIANKHYVDSVTVAPGGNGADGALSISSGTTTLDVGAAGVYIKNYTSISITSTGKLAFTNPHNNGTIVALYSQSGLTVTSSTVPAVDVSNMGAAVNYDGRGWGCSAGCAFVPAGDSSNYGNAANSVWVNMPGYGSACSPTGKCQSIQLFCGGSGANGSGGGAGGRGGGALYMECGGSLNITSTFWSKGQDGTTGAGMGAGSGIVRGGGGGGGFLPGTAGTGYAGALGSLTTAGGGGGGGSILIRAKTIATNTATFVVTAGAAASSTAGTAGAGGAGDYAVETI